MVHKNCQGCLNRKLACHDNCETYKAFKATLDAKSRFIKNDRDAVRVLQAGFWRRCKA
jgi:hypothetical protein